MEVEPLPQPTRGEARERVFTERFPETPSSLV
jgi:hypothetical protein